MPVKIFCCYAHEDEVLLIKLKTYLGSLHRQGLIDLWHDRDISAGTEWEHEIKERLNTSEVILLLISPDFMNSDYCYGVEMHQALKRHERGEAQVIPIILRPVYWKEAPFSKLQALPTDGTPVTSSQWHDIDEAMFNVTEGIRILLKQLLMNSDTIFYPREMQVQTNPSAGESEFDRKQESLRYLIFLLDQSGSMADTFDRSRAGSGSRKSDIVALILNQFLYKLIATNMTTRLDGTTEIKLQAEITVLGYADTGVRPALFGTLANKLLASLEDLHMHPGDVVMRKRREIDNEGQMVEQTVPFPVWVRPMAGGSTPMCAALYKTLELVKRWVTIHPNGDPPIVINVTDGLPTDGDPRPLAYQLHNIRTNRGEVLLYNVHITNLNVPPISYPSNEDELPNDRYAQTLFQMSSAMPETSRKLYQSFSKKTIAPSARGMIFNGDATSIRDLFSILI